MVRSGKRLAAAWLGVGLVWIGVAQASWGDEQPQKSQPAATQAKEEKPEPNVAKGRVTNSAGEPIAGATINLKNTLFYGSSAQVKTGKDGTYRVELARGVWHVTAQVDKVFNKKKLRIDLCPEVDEDFANTDGGVRNFTWKLTGEKEDGLGTYGKPVIVYQEPGDYSFQLNDVELTLTPDGPLVDGSKGQPITGKPESTGDGLAVKDVPLGRYKITARLVEEGKPAQPLKVRVRNKGSFVEAVTADFESPYPNLPIQRIEVELKKP
jgi:hypothetical protein